MDAAGAAQMRLTLADSGMVLDEHELATVTAVHRPGTAAILRALALEDVEPEVAFDPRWR